VAKAIYKQMEQDKTNHVWLSLEKMSPEDIVKRFPNIYKRCLEEGYDITKECIPVVPAQHYFMGGVKVDLKGRTSMKRLYAAGETACNGVHGANRLASNSLLESLVWAKAAAQNIVSGYEAVDVADMAPTLQEIAVELERIQYEDVQQTYHDSVRQRIKEDGKRREGMKNADLWSRE
jgi:L-aspartate oxidase